MKRDFAITSINEKWVGDITYIKTQNEFNIIQSFSQKGCPYDNACIESFHAVLKKEEVYRNTYEKYEDAKKSIFQYMESFLQ
ncbi:transposase IS3/IS911 family protein [Clostridium perfringens]|uniref:Transposase IS3/IS911 family protein n=1 Tax=Clostridium perfringens TaxID=1502 RepID=A0A2X3E7B5_CLOPF|nr:integrase core domain-containing protein [Clostridium perfringens]SQC06450.1 transposase IS3/IS911 family protein [Clostridium perfringens]